MAGAAGARVLAVLTRAPRSGGKTRLFAALGRPPDRALLDALLLDTLDGCAAPGVRRIVAVTPAWGCDDVRALIADAGAAAVVAQAEGDLGRRMRTLMAALFDEGACAVALVGSDLPHLTPPLVAEAFDRLAHDRDALVLGPAADGGYYLLAARRVPDVFAGMTWGGGDVLARTAAAAAAAGFRVHLLDPLEDVDTADALRHAAASGRAPRTAAWVRHHLDGGS